MAKRPLILRDIQAVFIDICRALEANPEIVRCRVRLATYVRQRQIIAKMLRGKGYGYPKIAIVMNRDASSVQYLCKDDMRARKKKKMKARYESAPLSMMEV